MTANPNPETYHIEVKCPFPPCSFIAKGSSTAECYYILDNHINLMHRRPD